jgi:hypothetical protein
MKCSRNRSNSFGQARSSLGNGPGNLGQHLSCRGSNRPGHNRQQFAGGHADQWQEVFGRFILRFRLGGEFSKMLHHRVRIDFADGAEFFFTLAFILKLFFTEQAPDHVADGAEPAFTFQSSFVLELIFHLVFELVFHLALEFSSAFFLEFRIRFQFSLELVCHDHSSCEIGRTLRARLVD